jgi:hypothetical protein
MIKKQLAPPDYFLIAANLIPVYGVWFEGWSATGIFIAYTLETMLVGVVTILKLGITTIAKGKDDWYAQGKTQKVSGLFFIFFFVVHYGMFVAIQTSLFSEVSNITKDNDGFFHFFFHWYEYVDRETSIMLYSLGASYAARDLLPFILKKEFKTTPMILIMFQPYGRIIVQQFIVILGGMLMAFSFGKAFIVVFAAVKIYFEVFLNFGKILNKTMEDMKSEIGGQKTED